MNLIEKSGQMGSVPGGWYQDKDTNVEYYVKFYKFEDTPKGEYLGGAIVPGIRLSAESLFLKTALLPKIEIQAPRHIIGKTTQESMLSGLFYGYGSLCKGMIDLLSVSLRGTSKASDEGPHTGHSQKLEKSNGNNPKKSSKEDTNSTKQDPQGGDNSIS